MIDLLRCARSCAISVLLDSMQLFQVRLRKKVKVKSVLFHGVRTWYYRLPSEQPTLFISFHRRRKIISRKYKEHASGHIRCRWPLWMRVAERRRLKMEPVLPPFQWTFLQRATFSESGDRFLPPAVYGNCVRSCLIFGLCPLLFFYSFSEGSQ
jgi:hypothetical protein